MKTFKAIVIDWDGAVVDTLPLKMRNAGVVFSAEFGVDADNVAESYGRNSGVNRRELFDLIANENLGRKLSDREFHRLSAEFTMLNVAAYQKSEVFDEKKRDFLEKMQRQSKQLFVSGSADQEEIRGLAELLNVRQYFTEILGSCDGFRQGKEHLDYIKNNYNIQNEDLVFIGDGDADNRLAEHPGIYSSRIIPDRECKNPEAKFADKIVDNIVESEVSRALV